MLKSTRFILLTLLIVVNSYINSFSQIKGKETPGFNPDTIFVFNSPRSLIYSETKNEITSAWGIDLMLSDNGFGLGMFFQENLTSDWIAFSSLYFSGARNTDELELYDRATNRFIVEDKINRLFMIPLTLGIERYFFRDVLHENLKPYLRAGLGPSFILSTPYENYENDFFKSFGKAKLYTRFGAFIGAGVDIGSGDNALVSVDIRYYYIPFGDEGLESIKDNPITDFGGIFLSLSLGARF
jgi:outer membrane protein W